MKLRIVVVASVLLVVVLLVVTLVVYDQQGKEHVRNLPNALRKGMTRAEVEAVVGKDVISAGPYRVEVDGQIRQGEGVDYRLEYRGFTGNMSYTLTVRFDSHGELASAYSTSTDEFVVKWGPVRP